MNERINNLFGQALDEAVPETWTTLDADQLNRLKYKFAELIVREVFVKIEDERFEIYQPVKESVMKHFGVEE